VELPKEGGFKFTARMIASLIDLENFVHAFKKECPKLVQRAIISYKIWDMYRIVVVGPDNGWAIQLL